MLVRATHSTRYSYEGPVSHCLSEARLTPRILPTQKLQDWSISVSPTPSNIVSRKDYFGNDVSSFSVLETHHTFSVTATSLIEVLPVAYPLQVPVTCGDAQQVLARAEEPEALAANEFCWESPFVPWVGSLKEYAADVLKPGRPLLEAAETLMRQIYKDFTYKPEATSIETPLAEVYANRKGVCQDYAHVMIGALRTHGLAARYVSGYLRGDAGLEGAQASHAWVSVFIPTLGWLDFDPTNNMIPSTSHVTLAWGRDFGDVTPVKGITVGGGKHTLAVDVRVLGV